jgi:glycosyltransferase involved in cell wall biosynthesis
MRVCFVVGTLGQGGAERQLIYMLRALVSRGISTSVVTLTQGEYFEESISQLGIPIRHVDKTRIRLRRLQQLIGAVRKERPNIIQSSHFFTNIYAGTCGRLLVVPSIGAIRSDFVSEIRSHGKLGRLQVRLPHRLIANSRAAYDQAVIGGISPNRIEFVQNVVEISNTKKRSGQTSTLNIVFVGRLDADKRPEDFVDLAESLNSRFQDKRLVFQIAGDGPRRGELERLAKQKRISSDKLIFCGSVSDMDSLYRNADILVSTSKREGTSNVILEAMANGLAVVATNVGGTPAIVDKDRGILVEPEDPTGLLNAVTELILNDDLRIKMGASGKDYTVENHSISYLQQRLPAIYETLVSNGH